MVKGTGCLKMRLVIALTILSSTFAIAQSREISGRVNEHLFKTSERIEKQRQQTEIQNYYLAPRKDEPEFTQKNPTQSFGVDMRLEPSLPEYTYDHSRPRGSSDAVMESVNQQQQNMDFKLEENWRQFKKEYQNGERDLSSAR
jgi:hypothetical protein